MGNFLLILFIIFFVIPLIRVVYTVYRVRKRMRDAMRGMYDAARQPASEQQPRKAGWSRTAVRRKKIGDDVGEYVKFEELQVSAGVETDNRCAEVPYDSEPQVSDADWEDIK